MALADCFCGRVEQEEYVQPLVKERVVMAWKLWVGKFCRQTFRFEGCTFSEANTSSSVTVTDTYGQTYTFTPIASFTDSSKGYGIVPKEVCTVTRTRTSPHLWTLVFTRTGCKATDGSQTLDGPTWMPNYI